MQHPKCQSTLKAAATSYLNLDTTRGSVGGESQNLSELSVSLSVCLSVSLSPDMQSPRCQSTLKAATTSDYTRGSVGGGVVDERSEVCQGLRSTQHWRTV